jgi:hypothetical protein
VAAMMRCVPRHVVHTPAPGGGACSHCAETVSAPPTHPPAPLPSSRADARVSWVMIVSRGALAAGDSATDITPGLVYLSLSPPTPPTAPSSSQSMPVQSAPQWDCVPTTTASLPLHQTSHPPCDPAAFEGVHGSCHSAHSAAARPHRRSLPAHCSVAVPSASFCAAAAVVVDTLQMLPDRMADRGLRSGRTKNAQRHQLLVTGGAP